MFALLILCLWIVSANNDLHAMESDCGACEPAEATVLVKRDGETIVRVIKFIEAVGEQKRFPLFAAPPNQEEISDEQALAIIDFSDAALRRNTQILDKAIAILSQVPYTQEKITGAPEAYRLLAHLSQWGTKKGADCVHNGFIKVLRDVDVLKYFLTAAWEIIKTRGWILGIVSHPEFGDDFRIIAFECLLKPWALNLRRESDKAILKEREYDYRSLMKSLRDNGERQGGKWFDPCVADHIGGSLCSALFTDRRCGCSLPVEEAAPPCLCRGVAMRQEGAVTDPAGDGSKRRKKKRPKKRAAGAKATEVVGVQEVYFLAAQFNSVNVNGEN